LETRRERGAILGIVLILMAVLLAAGVFAFWGLKSDTGAAGRDRLARQLFDCAEQGLALGKQQFGNTYRSQWNQYLAAKVCSNHVSCPPLPPDAQRPGSAVDGYPDTPPFQGTVDVPTIDSAKKISLQYHVAIYNNPENPPSPWIDTDNTIIIYSRCLDPSTQQSRSVQAVVQVPLQVSNDYSGQAGRGFRNQGNSNF
jgi:hypothetical protein